MKNTLILFVFVSHLLTAQNYKYGKVSIDELAEKTNFYEPNASAAVLYNERTTKYEYDDLRGFYLIENYFMRVKLYNKEGFDYANIEIPLHSGGSIMGDKLLSLKATTYNLTDKEIEKVKLENQNIYDLKVNKYLSLKKFTMPKIKEGSVIEIEYSIESPYFYNLNDFVFQKEIPVHKNNMKIFIPEYFVYNIKTKGYHPIKIEDEKITRSMTFRYESLNTRETDLTERGIATVEFKETKHSMSTDYMPSLKEEPYCGNIENYTAGFVFELSYTKFPGRVIETYTKDWKSVTEKIYELEDFGDELKKEKYFEEDLTSIIGNTSDDLTKVGQIFQFVKSKIKPNGIWGIYTDLGVVKSYKTQVGNVSDINLNLVNFLRFAGFDANPVLVSTINHGIPLYPSIKSFNYVIVVVNFPEGIVLLDASDPLSTPNNLPEYVFNYNGREIRKDGSSRWISLYPPFQSSQKIVMSLKWSEDGFEGSSRKVLNNIYAKRYRKKMFGLTNETMLENIKLEYENIEILDFRLTNLEDFSNDVSEVIKLSTDSYFEEVSDKIFIDPLLFETTNQNPFKTENREFPIYFNFPWAESISINITIPENYRVFALPESKQMVLPDELGGFVYEVTQINNTIKVESNIVINNPVVEFEKYQTLKDFYREIVLKQTEKIVLIKN